MTDFKTLIGKVAGGKSLTRAEAEQAFDVMMSGEATPSQMGGFLMALRVRGETVDEIAGAVATMRAKVLPVDAPDDAMDVVGTGGDAAGTYNISTTTALVVAGVGVPIAKHGNRALSSKSGAADVLTALGVRIDLSPEGISRCIREAGIGFMFAPAHHPALKHVGPSRVEMGTRTMFNLLGPQSNPAGARRYMMGVYSKQWVEPVAAALLANRAISAWVVHGDSGPDEISTTGPTFVASIKGGNLTSFEITPEDAGIPRASFDDLKGGDPVYNAQRLQALLEGVRNPYRDIVLLNAAAAFIVAGRADTLKLGAELAAQEIDSGRAKDTLDALVRVSNS